MQVVSPEDVIGLKVQAMVNDPDRQTQELADIERLMSFYGKRLDWERVQEYYDLFNLGAEARQFRRRYGHAE